MSHPAFELEDGTRPGACLDKTVDEIDFEIGMLKQEDAQLMGEFNEREGTDAPETDKQYRLYRSSIMGRHYKIREEMAKLQLERSVIIQRRKDAAKRAGRMAALPKFVPDAGGDHELLIGLETQRQIILLYKQALVAASLNMSRLLGEAKKRGILDRQMSQDIEEWL